VCVWPWPPAKPPPSVPRNLANTQLFRFHGRWVVGRPCKCAVRFRVTGQIMWRPGTLPLAYQSTVPTSAMIARRMASGRVGHAAATLAKSGSLGAPVGAQFSESLDLRAFCGKFTSFPSWTSWVRIPSPALLFSPLSMAVFTLSIVVSAVSASAVGTITLVPLCASQCTETREVWCHIR
jgi:hypothetical protein